MPIVGVSAVVSMTVSGCVQNPTTGTEERFRYYEVEKAEVLEENPRDEAIIRISLSWNGPGPPIQHECEVVVIDRNGSQLHRATFRVKADSENREIRTTEQGDADVAQVNCASFPSAMRSAQSSEGTS